MNRPDIKNWAMIVILTSLLVGCSPSSPAKTLTTAAPQLAATATSQPSIQLQPCVLGEIPAQCGVLTVSENRASNTGRTIDIHVAVIKASGPNPEPDPIFYVAGGPGASGIEDAAYAQMVLKSATGQRDLVLFDQRGTGQSNRMACPRQMEESLALVPIDDKMLQDLRACLAQLDGDPGAYTTAWGMDDLDDVRAALGYDQINLYGESYGPTAEQVYLVRHAAHVRTVALEGVTLLDVPMFERMPRSSQAALDLLVGRCRADLACNTAYPNLSAEVKALLAQLEKQPVELSLVNPHTGLPFRLTRSWLVLGMHNLLLLTPTAVQLPGLLHQVYLGDWSTIANLLSNAFAPDSPLPEWNIMNLTIICHEDWARARRAETTRFSTQSYMRYEDVRTFLAPEQVCALIPRPQPEALYQPVTTSPVPVLIISDQADPQNPPENVANAQEHYPNSLALVAPGQGHGYTGFTCRDQILADFIEKGTTQGLNADCLQQEPLPSFK